MSGATWRERCAVGDDAEWERLADVHEKALDAALMEVGRPDLIGGVPIGPGLTQSEMADKALVWRANTIAIGVVGVPFVPCLTCWLHDVEDSCPGVAPMLGRAAESHEVGSESALSDEGQVTS